MCRRLGLLSHSPAELSAAYSSMQGIARERENEAWSYSCAFRFQEWGLGRSGDRGGRVFLGFLPCMLRTLHSTHTKRLGLGVASQVRGRLGLGSVHSHRAWKDKNVGEENHGPSRQICPTGERPRTRLPAPFATSALPASKAIMPNTALVHETHLHHLSKPIWSDCVSGGGTFQGGQALLLHPAHEGCLVDKRRSLERSAASPPSKAWPAPPSPPPCAHASPSPPIDLLH